MPYDYDCGNGIIWRIPDDVEPVIPKRKIRILQPTLSEAEEAVNLMREFYKSKSIPIPQWEEDFGQAMIDAEKAPNRIEPPISEKETIPPMPEYGTQEFFLWCRKTKKAREALAAEKAAEKAAKASAKAAAKAAAKAEKESKKKVVKPVENPVEKPVVKVKPRIKPTQYLATNKNEDTSKMEYSICKQEEHTVL